MKLTNVQRECLAQCLDWSAPYEVTRRRHVATGRIISPAGTQQALGRLRNLGLVKYSLAQGTYRATDAGRAALEKGARDA